MLQVFKLCQLLLHKYSLGPIMFSTSINSPTTYYFPSSTASQTRNDLQIQTRPPFTTPTAQQTSTVCADALNLRGSSTPMYHHRHLTPTATCHIYSLHSANICPA